MSSGRALVAAVALLGASTVGVIGMGGAAPAQAAGCTAPSIAVVVDYGSLGGVQRSCVGAGGSGLRALGDAFSVVQVLHQPGFVCRINGQPTASHDKCVVTPPTSRYWAYFHVQPGSSSWSYSGAGAANYTPKPGSAEGWSFGSGAAPRMSPAAALPAARPKPNPVPKPKSRAPSTHRTAPAQIPTAAPTSAPVPATTSQRGSGSSSPRSSSSESPSTSSAAAAPSVVEASSRPAAERGSSGTNPAPAAAATGILGALALGGWYLARRRRTGS